MNLNNHNILPPPPRPPPPSINNENYFNYFKEFQNYDAFMRDFQNMNLNDFNVFVHYNVVHIFKYILEKREKRMTEYRKAVNNIKGRDQQIATLKRENDELLQHLVEENNTNEFLKQKVDDFDRIRHNDAMIHQNTLNEIEHLQQKQRRWSETFKQKCAELRNAKKNLDTAEKEIKCLENQLKNSKNAEMEASKIHDLETQNKSLKAVNKEQKAKSLEMETKIAEMSKRISVLEAESAKAEVKCATMESENNQLKEDLEAANEQISQFSEANTNIEEEFMNLNEKLFQKEKELKNIFSKVESIEAKLKEGKAEDSSLFAQIQIDQLKQALEIAKDQCQKLQDDSYQKNESLINITKECNEATIKVEPLADTAVYLENLNQKLIDEKAEAAVIIEVLKEENQKHKDKIEGLQREARNAKRRVSYDGAKRKRMTRRDEELLLSEHLQALRQNEATSAAQSTPQLGHMQFSFLPPPPPPQPQLQYINTYQIQQQHQPPQPPFLHSPDALPEMNSPNFMPSLMNMQLIRYPNHHHHQQISPPLLSPISHLQRQFSNIYQHPNNNNNNNNSC